MTTVADSRFAGDSGWPSRPGRLRPLALAGLMLAACGGTDADTDAGADAGPSEPITLYTCLSDESIQPVIDAFEKSGSGGQVDLFRAPTGELNARVASDARSGGL